MRGRVRPPPPRSGDIQMPNPTRSAPARVRARCVELASVFQSPLLEEPLGSGATTSVRRQHDELIGQAQAACRECPLIADCLYAAVVEHDVAGFVAGTTPAQRLADPAPAADHRGARGLRHPGRGDRAAPPGRPRRAAAAAERPSRREPGAPGPPARLLAVDGEAASAEASGARRAFAGPSRSSRPCAAVLAAAADVVGPPPAGGPRRRNHLALPASCSFGRCVRSSRCAPVTSGVQRENRTQRPILTGGRRA